MGASLPYGLLKEGEADSASRGRPEEEESDRSVQYDSTEQA